MTFSQSEPINVRHLTTRQSLRGGIIPLHQGRLLVALHTHHLPSTRSLAAIYRVSSIGGPQGPGETLWDCAHRSARNILSTDVTLHPSPTTYFHNIDTGEVYSVPSTDEIPPFLLERQSNYASFTPQRSGLSSGTYSYFGFFLTYVQPENLSPGDHIKGLLLLAPELWPALSQRPTLDTLVQSGAQLIEREPLSRSHQLWLHPDGSLGHIMSLLQTHPELLQP